MKQPGEYEAGQVTFALQHLAAAAGHIRLFGGQISPEQLATMRKAQIEIEIAAKALETEPPPRGLSRIAFEPKTRLFVIFGGDHLDYLTNDLWVFDPVKRSWFQRHPELDCTTPRVSKKVGDQRHRRPQIHLHCTPGLSPIGLGSKA